MRTLKEWKKMLSFPRSLLSLILFLFESYFDSQNLCASAYYVSSPSLRVFQRRGRHAYAWKTVNNLYQFRLRDQTPWVIACPLKTFNKLVLSKNIFKAHIRCCSQRDGNIGESSDSKIPTPLHEGMTTNSTVSLKTDSTIPIPLHKLPTSTAYLYDEETRTHIYLVGTFHLSQVSAQDVRSVIRTVRPGYVMVELCPDRYTQMFGNHSTFFSNASKPKLSGTHLMRRSANSSAPRAGTLRIGKALSTIYGAFRQSGVEVGSEFLAAQQEAARLGGECRLVLGDMDAKETLEQVTAPPAARPARYRRTPPPRCAARHAIFPRIRARPSRAAAGSSPTCGPAAAGARRGSDALNPLLPLPSSIPPSPQQPFAARMPPSRSNGRRSRPFDADDSRGRVQSNSEQPATRVRAERESRPPP